MCFWIAIGLDKIFVVLQKETHTLGFINANLEGNAKIPADFLGSW